MKLDSLYQEHFVIGRECQGGEITFHQLTTDKIMRYA